MENKPDKSIKKAENPGNGLHTLNPADIMLYFPENNNGDNDEKPKRVPYYNQRRNQNIHSNLQNLGYKIPFGAMSVGMGDLLLQCCLVSRSRGLLQQIRNEDHDYQRDQRDVETAVQLAQCTGLSHGEQHFQCRHQDQRQETNDLLREMMVKLKLFHQLSLESLGQQLNAQKDNQKLSQEQAHQDEGIQVIGHKIGAGAHKAEPDPIAPDGHDLLVSIEGPIADGFLQEVVMAGQLFDLLADTVAGEEEGDHLCEQAFREFGHARDGQEVVEQGQVPELHQAEDEVGAIEDVHEDEGIPECFAYLLGNGFHCGHELLLIGGEHAIGDLVPVDPENKLLAVPGDEQPVLLRQVDLNPIEIVRGDNNVGVDLEKQIALKIDPIDNLSDDGVIQGDNTHADELQRDAVVEQPTVGGQLHDARRWVPEGVPVDVDNLWGRRRDCAVVQAGGRCQGEACVAAALCTCCCICCCVYCSRCCCIVCGVACVVGYVCRDCCVGCRGCVGAGLVCCISRRGYQNQANIIKQRPISSLIDDIGRIFKHRRSIKTDNRMGSQCRIVEDSRNRDTAAVSRNIIDGHIVNQTVNGGPGVRSINDIVIAQLVQGGGLDGHVLADLILLYCNEIQDLGQNASDFVLLDLELQSGDPADLLGEPARAIAGEV